MRFEKQPKDDHLIVDRIKELLAERPRFGCPRVHLVLRSEGLVRNHKKTERIYYSNGLQLKKRRPKRKIYKPENPLPPLVKANSRWSLDFVHDNLVSGRAIRILTIIDEWSRECPAMEVDTSLSGHRVVRALEKLKLERGIPEEIGVDQGPEFISKALTKWAADNGVRLHYATPGNKNENAFIESYNGRLRDECLNMHWFSNLKDAREIIEDWRVDYNERRPHTSLGGMTPKKFAETKGLRLVS